MLYQKEENEDEGDDELDPDDEDVVGRHTTCSCQSAPNFSMKYHATPTRSS
jgi:hypothetical protein